MFSDDLIVKVDKDLVALAVEVRAQRPAQPLPQTAADSAAPLSLTGSVRLASQSLHSLQINEKEKGDVLFLWALFLFGGKAEQIFPHYTTQGRGQGPECPRFRRRMGQIELLIL